MSQTTAGFASAYGSLAQVKTNAIKKPRRRSDLATWSSQLLKVASSTFTELVFVSVSALASEETSAIQVLRRDFLFSYADALKSVSEVERMLFKYDGEWLRLLVVLKEDSIDAIMKVAEIEAELGKTNKAKIDSEMVEESDLTEALTKGYRSL